MKPIKYAMLSLSLALITASMAHGWDEEPVFLVEDYDEALSLAELTGKDMLVDFSGSDWCGWCMKLDEEVFSQNEFIDEARKDFILVVLDFPDKKENKAKIKNPKRNAEIKARFKVSGYPTVLLLDNKGIPYARTGYRKGGPAAYTKHLRHLKESHNRMKSLLENAGEAGSGQAAALLEVFEYIEGLEELDFGYNLSVGFPDFSKRAVRAIDLDPKDESGLKSKAVNFLLADAENKMRVERDPEGALTLVEGILTKNTFVDKQREVWARYLAGSACLQAKGDKKKALAHYKRALELGPANPRLADYLKKQIAEMEGE